MNEIVSWVALGLSVVLGLLVIVQTMRVGRIEKQFRALTRGVKPGASAMSLGDLVAMQGAKLDATREEVHALHASLNSLTKVVGGTVQCMGLVRFNPFDDMGGDQSFALALLDRHGDGIILSSLHHRAATRFYAKPVKGGASHIPLSDEELQALQQALAKREA